MSSPNHVMEEPAAEIGYPTGLRVLDLGCGDASLGRTLLGAGATSYIGTNAPVCFSITRTRTRSRLCKSPLAR
jgi:predicted RNA methylase